MGCDIHSIAQVLQHGTWFNVGKSIGGDNRSYDTFAVLANVRNGQGVAGCETGEGWNSISEPRGLPEVSKDDNDIEGFGWLGDHSFSYVTLAEINAVLCDHKNKTYMVTGVITKQQWDELRVGSIPNEYCGGIVGSGLMTIDQDDIYSTTEKFTHVRARWAVPAIDRLSCLQKYSERLEILKIDHNIDSDNDVRLVFGFDS